MDLQLKKITLISLLATLLVASALAEVFEECERTNSRTFIQSNRSCSHYIFCDGETSYEGECAPGEYFNERYQTCDPQDMVDCPLEQKTTNQNTANTGPNTVPTIAPTAGNFSIPPTLGTATTAAANVTNMLSTTTTTTASTQLNNFTTMAPLITTTTATSAFSLPNIFNFTNTITGSMTPNTPNTPLPLPNTTTPTNSGNDTTNSPGFIIAAECPQVDNPQQVVFVTHPKSCTDYFMCYSGEARLMHCSGMLHFNVNTGKCDYAENVRCQIQFVPPKEQCQSYTSDLYAYSKNCNYFYSCQGGYLLLQQCPFFYGWDYEKRNCVPMNQAKCYGPRQQ